MSRLLESATARGTEAGVFRALESGVSGGPVVYSDNFNRADTTTVDLGGAGLGAEWLAPSWRVGSNTAIRHISGGSDFAIFQHDLGTLDMWCEADVTPNGASGSSDAYGVINVRSEVAISNCYMGFWDPGITAYVIGMNISGSFSSLASGGTGSPPGGNNGTKKLRLEAQGTALRLYVNDVLTVSTTNGVINSVDSPNNRYAGMNSNYGPSVDNYRCGALPYTP